MIIRRKWRREWARLLVRVVALVTVLIIVVMFLRVRRIEGTNMEPNYKDGDLVLMWRSDETPFLQLRVRGFDD